MVTRKQILTGFVLGVLFIGYYFLCKYTSFSIQCLFHLATGYYCPGCGITRMFFALMKLQIYQAFRYNPVVFILLCLYIIYFLLKNVFKKKLIIPKQTYYILIGILIVFGILRNIPMFSILEPTIIK